MKVYKSTVLKLSESRLPLNEFLIKLTGLSPTEVSDAAQKGAVWIQRGGKGKILRIRNPEEIVSPQDVIQLFFDRRVLELPSVRHSSCIYEDKNYGVWVKEAGVVPQGTQTGDHASLLRYVEIQKGHEVYLVHRLDRETRGLMLVAYHSKAAALLSELFQKNAIRKEYEAIVLGELERGHKETITASLDDKEAMTHIESLGSSNNRTHLRVTIETGRLHQIRRHLDHIGHPVMGDPKYGRGNKNRQGLMLVAVSLRFQDPWTKKNQEFRLPEGLGLRP